MRPLARVVWATMRPPVLLLLVLYAACGLAQGGATGVAAMLRVLLVVAPFLAYSAVVNDLADERIDRVNLPADARRVLVSGAAHRRQLWVVAALAAAVTVLAALSLGWAALAVAAAGLAVSTAYSLGPVRLAERGILASLALPACYVAVPLLLGLLVGRGSVRAGDLPLLAALYIGFVGRIILKDFRDLRGDALFGKRTFLVRHGRVWTCRVSALCWVAAAVLLVSTRPGVTPAYVLTTAAGTAGALVLLRDLARDRGHRRDEWAISALAIVGRGLVLVLAVDLAAPAAGWPAQLTAAVIVALASVLGRQAARMRRHGPTRGMAAAPGPVPACALTANTAGSGDFPRGPGR